MKKPGKESILIAGYIAEFLDGYVLSQKTNSMNTLKSYQDAIVLYLSFLEDEKKVRSDSLNADCFRHTVIEEWLVWLRESRGCSPESCNNRLASLRTFLNETDINPPAELGRLADASGDKQSTRIKPPLYNRCRSGKPHQIQRRYIHGQSKFIT